MTEHRDSEIAFAEAIKAGVLSDDPQSERYAGAFMYMHTESFRWNYATGRRRGGRVICRHAFKHIDTRGYIFAPAPKRAA